MFRLSCGSPPRMRGKRRPLREPPQSARITPAHAGKTGENRVERLLPADHPRACGENASWQAIPCRNFGSPPRMRGKRSTVSTMVMPTRITPAHAGKTTSTFAGACASADHPRACGENEREASAPRMPSGSPPRMRGKQAFKRWVTSEVRITPAHAGKTNPIIRFMIKNTDHPRACGENAGKKSEIS